MKEIILDDLFSNRIDHIYREMENAYNAVAAQLEFSCTGCPDNCCDSYFEHHTYAEWSFLWLGFRQLPLDKQQQILQRAFSYQQDCTVSFSRNERPQVMCPLNEEGRCIVYRHRLIVCRTHGVPATMTRPDGRRISFPGCFRCQELIKARGQNATNIPSVDRTALLRRFALLENELFDGRRHLYPKIKLTIAQMLLKGPPSISTPHCDR
jgi:hypothetical protein